MAEYKSKGTAINIDMAVIKRVPVNIGMAPKLPDEPTWPSLIAVCGDQWIPNRNSLKLTCEKNLTVSKIKDKIIPKVVKTATMEKTKKINFNIFSTFLLASNLTLSFLPARYAKKVVIQIIKVKNPAL